MFEEYVTRAKPEERRRAFALDCVIRLEGVKTIRSLKEPLAKHIVGQAKILEDYLAGSQ